MVVRNAKELFAVLRKDMKNTKMRADTVCMLSGLDKGFFSRTIRGAVDVRLSTALRILSAVGYELVLRRKDVNG